MANIIAPLVVIAASVFFYIHTYSFPESLGYQELGPGFWPRLTLAGMIIVAAIICGRSLIASRKESRPESSGDSKAFVLMIVLLVLYIFAIHITGFLPASLLMLLAFMRLLGEKNKVVIFSTALGLVAVVYLIFAKIMVAPLPRGVSIFKALSYYLY